MHLGIQDDGLFTTFISYLRASTRLSQSPNLGETQPEAKVVVAAAGVEVVTERRATVPGEVAPVTATAHAVRTIGWTCGISL